MNAWRKSSPKRIIVVGAVFTLVILAGYVSLSYDPVPEIDVQQVLPKAGLAAMAFVWFLMVQVLSNKRRIYLPLAFGFFLLLVGSFVDVLGEIYALADERAKSTSMILGIATVSFGFFFWAKSGLKVSMSNRILKQTSETLEESKGWLEERVLERTAELRRTNEILRTQVKERMRAEKALLEAHHDLEHRIEERTAELSEANKLLRQENVERKHAEERQAQLVEEVESINEELKSFAYIVSHDLKAPLRGIGSIAEWLIADYEEKLDDAGKKQLHQLRSRVERTQDLINGILQYSRLGRTKEEKVQLDLNRLVPQVVDMIAPPKHISIIIKDQLPVMVFEKTRMEQVFQNLIGNAVKYMDKPEGKVVIDCVPDNGHWKFSVSDNGPGIKEKHFDRIFQMFQTLAPRDGVESTGVGLSLVKKIVETNGGRIWVESDVGKGSTFCFELPRQM